MAKHRGWWLLLLCTPGLACTLVGLWLVLRTLARGEPFVHGTVGTVATGLLGVLFGIAVHHKAVQEHRRRGRSYARTVLFVTLPAAVLSIAAVFLLDLGFGLWFRATAATTPLLFPPHATLPMHTSEFHCTVTTNALGLRDDEVPPDPDPTELRILAIGDSFTYGWGVELAEAWPKVLEQQLRANGHRVRVHNLGCPGTTVDDYTAAATAAIPVLRPQLVLVGVLSGDDLAQLQLRGHSHWIDELRWWLADLWPNLDRFYHAPRPRPLPSLQAEWRDQVAEFQGGLGPAEQQRYRQLDPEIAARLQALDVSPHLIALAVHHPEYLLLSQEPERPATARSIQGMADHLQRLAQVAHRHGADVQVVVVPYAAYVSPLCLSWHRRAGFEAPEALLTSEGPEQAILAACTAAQVAAIPCTAAFRNHTREHDDLYFALDGHCNARGHELLATTIAAALRQRNWPPPRH